MLYGPILPIYGVGGLLITIILSNIDNMFLIFMISLIVCTILEYLTSYILEKIFHKRWWDYSKSYLNINGRVCLFSIMLFGIIGLFIKKIFIVYLDKLYYLIPNMLSSVILMLLFSIFLVDLIYSMIINIQNRYV